MILWHEDKDSRNEFVKTTSKWGSDFHNAYSGYRKTVRTRKRLDWPMNNNSSAISLVSRTNRKTSEDSGGLVTDLVYYTSQ